MNPTLPIIHLNGTSPRELSEGYRRIADALMDVQEAFAKLEFNARDYYPTPGLWEKARAEMMARHQAISDMREEILQIAAHCQTFIKTETRSLMDHPICCGAYTRNVTTDEAYAKGMSEFNCKHCGKTVGIMRRGV